MCGVNAMNDGSWAKVPQLYGLIMATRYDPLSFIALVAGMTTQ